MGCIKLEACLAFASKLVVDKTEGGIDGIVVNQIHPNCMELSCKRIAGKVANQVLDSIEEALLDT